MAVAIVITILTVAYATQAFQLSLGDLRSVGPGAFPVGLVVGMALCLTIIFYKETKARKEGKASRGNAGRHFQIAGIGATLAYALALEPLGYLVTTPVYVFVMAMVFGMLQRAKAGVEGLSGGHLLRTAVLASAGVTGLAYLLFQVLFDFRLP